MKIKNFGKYIKEGVLKYFKISVKFLNFKVKYFIAHPSLQHGDNAEIAIKTENSLAALNIELMTHQQIKNHHLL